MKQSRQSSQDRYVSERIREARIACKKTQSELADLIGVSYQQVQKYESGTNRVPTARLTLLVSALNRPLKYFLPDVTDVRMQIDPFVNKFMASREGQEIARTFFRLPPGARTTVLTLIKQLAAREET